ncbi:MAG: hypothetical protein ACTSVI_07805 [Promethearchaeota archaeon]
MKIKDLEVILIQNFGMDTKLVNDYIITFWRISDDLQREILFYIDEDTNLIYISTAFHEIKVDNAMLRRLLKENLKLSLAKFCLDKSERVLILCEIPNELEHLDLLKRGIFAVYNATEKFYEILKRSSLENKKNESKR